MMSVWAFVRASAKMVYLCIGVVCAVFHGEAALLVMLVCRFPLLARMVCPFEPFRCRKEVFPCDVRFQSYTNMSG